MTVKSVGNGKYVLMSKKTGKRLSKPASKEATMKREKQVQFFKNNEKYKKDHGDKGIPVKSKRGKK